MREGEETKYYQSYSLEVFDSFVKYKNIKLYLSFIRYSDYQIMRFSGEIVQIEKVRMIFVYIN